MTPHIHTGHCDNCEAQAKTIKQLEDYITVIRGAVVKGEPIGTVKTLEGQVQSWTEEARRYAENADYWRTKCDTLEANNAKLREDLKRIARYDVGLQALIEDGADTPENRAKYYEGLVEYRRSIARAALQETER